MVPGLECYIWSSAFLTGKPQKQTPQDLHPAYPRRPSLYFFGANAPTRFLRLAPLGKPCQLLLPPQLAWIIGNKRLTRKCPTHGCTLAYVTPRSRTNQVHVQHHETSVSFHLDPTGRYMRSGDRQFPPTAG